MIDLFQKISLRLLHNSAFPRQLFREALMRTSCIKNLRKRRVLPKSEHQLFEWFNDLLLSIMLATLDWGAFADQGLQNIMVDKGYHYVAFTASRDGLFAIARCSYET